MPSHSAVHGDSGSSDPSTPDLRFYAQGERGAERIAEWLARPLAELRAHFLEKRARIPRGLLPALEADSREGARQLAKRLRAHEAENRAEGQRLRHLLHFELELWERGFQRVAGVDEAGMAPLAGPVVAAAVILPKGFKLRGLDDSKKVLDPAVRESLAEKIKAEAICWAVGMAEVEEIDRLNIYHAGLLAMRRAVEGLSPAPDYLLVDARTVPEVPMSQRGIIHGDALSASIAAASMIAKTTRDAHMAELDRVHPGWELDRHKGYPTPRHFALLKERGVSAVHRRSFRPVREALGLEPLQAELFPEPPAPETDEELETG